MWGLGCLGFAVRVGSRSEKPGEPTQIIHPDKSLEKSPTARPLAHLGSSIFRPMSQSPAFLASGTPGDCDKAMAALPPSPPTPAAGGGRGCVPPGAAAILEAQIVGRFSHLPRQRCPLLKPRARRDKPNSRQAPFLSLDPQLKSEFPHGALQGFRLR